MRRSSSNLLLFPCALLVLGSLAAPAAAGEGADEHVRKGIELRKAHRDLDALEEFRAAYLLSPLPQIRAQLALAEQAAGQWTAAESDLQAALEADDDWIAHNQEALKEALSFVALHLAWLEVDSNVQGAELFVNGVSAGRLPLPTPARVVVGNAIVRVQADGYIPAERSVPLEAGEHAREYVVLNARPVWPDHATDPTAVPLMAPLSGAQEKPRHGAPVPWVPLGVTGAGVLALGIGGVYGVMTLVDKAARDEHCGPHVCDATGVDLDRQARRDSTASSIAFGVGGVATLVGGWLLWRALARGPVQVAPAISRTAASVEMGGSF